MSYSIKTFAPGTYQDVLVEIAGNVWCPLDTNLGACTVEFDQVGNGRLPIQQNGIQQYKMPFRRFYINGTVSAAAQVVIGDCGSEFPQVALPLNPAPVELNAVSGSAVISANNGGGAQTAVVIAGQQPGGGGPIPFGVDPYGYGLIRLDGPGSNAQGLRSKNAESTVNTGSGEWDKAILTAGHSFGGNPIAGGFSLAAGSTVAFGGSNIGKGFKRIKIYWNASGPGLVVEAQYNQAPHTGAWIVIVDGSTPGALAAGEYCYASDGTTNGTGEALNNAAGMKMNPAPCMAYFNFRVRNASASAFTLTWLQWEVETF